MTQEIKVVGSKTPVTALSLQHNLLFVGEGPFLRIYDELGSVPLHWGQGFVTQTIHGFTPLKDSNENTYNLLFWGGRYLKTLSVTTTNTSQNSSRNASLVSTVVLGECIESPDWILDVCERDLTIVALTAHNELLYIDASQKVARLHCTGPPLILFSAHLTFLDDQTVLVAGGTAFGDVLIWTCSLHDSSANLKPKLHYILSGHEGSIFGVRISAALNSSTEPRHPFRIVSSCSDDRTIRVWNISDLTCEVERDDEQNTGFGSSEGSSQCLATAMGHLSRIWHLRYVYGVRNSELGKCIVRIVSFGEDTTCQSWDLLETASNESTPTSKKYELGHVRTISCHDGKNIWAVDVSTDIASTGAYRVITGGADGAISSFYDSIQITEESLGFTQTWELYQNPKSGDIKLFSADTVPSDNAVTHQAKNDRLHIRTIALLSENRILGITNDGHGLISSTDKLSESDTNWQKSDAFTQFVGVEQFHHLSPTPDGYFLFMVSKSRKDLYCFDVRQQIVYEIHDFKEPIAGLWGVGEVDTFSSTSGKKAICLVVSLLGSKNVHFVVLKRTDTGELQFEQSFIRILRSGANQFVTSSVPPKSLEHGLLAVGYRHGNIDILGIPETSDASESDRFLLVKHTIEKVHGNDAVTGLVWLSPAVYSDRDCLLLSAGRDGYFTAHNLKYEGELLICDLVHRISLPTGTCLEGLYMNLEASATFVYGFFSTQFVVYNVATLQQVVSIPCGAHRTWCFRPRVSTHENKTAQADFQGSLVWLQASKLKIVHNLQPSRRFVREGGHGREIKASASATMRWSRTDQETQLVTLLATGAEDTNIRIFMRIENTDTEEESFQCVAVLKKHTTGIQRLAWTRDWLFSSASLEEFYIWRINYVFGLGLVVRFESACPWKSDDADSRIMGFDVEFADTDTHTPRFLITLAYSNSILKIFTYTPSSTNGSWKPLASGTYTGACLTHVSHLAIYPRRVVIPLTTATDGHLAIWEPVACEGFTGQDAIKREQRTNPLRSKRVHQSSIKSCTIQLVDHIPETKSTYFVFTGGDDNALGLSTVEISILKSTGENDGCSVTASIDSLLIPNAHAGAITSAKVLSWSPMKMPDPQGGEPSACNRFQLASVGADQRIKTWEAVIFPGRELQSLNFRKIGDHFTSIADPACMSLYHDSSGNVSERAWGVICGIGLEIVHFGKYQKLESGFVS